MLLIPHLSFNGQCEAAFKLYEACLGGKITFLLTYGASPAAADAPEMADKIVHATLQVGDQRITGADVAPGRYAKPQGFSVQLNVDDPGDAERIFNTLAEGGRVTLPLQQTFWARRYGVVTDRFGTPWEINCGTPSPD
jgi:PhnB protein